MIATFEWAKAVATCAQTAGRTVLFEERPHRGSIRARDALTREILASLEADASFPIDGTGMAIQLLTDGLSGALGTA
jgi:hypothetical protein